LIKISSKKEDFSKYPFNQFSRIVTSNKKRRGYFENAAAIHTLRRMEITDNLPVTKIEPHEPDTYHDHETLMRTVDLKEEDFGDASVTKSKKACRFTSALEPSEKA
jgi:hypothetical protein